MLLDNKDVEDELSKLRYEIAKLSQGNYMPETINREQAGHEETEIIEYLIEERRKTNKILTIITERINRIEENLSHGTQANTKQQPVQATQQVLLSDTDATIVNFIQTKEMVCADDVKEMMKYGGRNAASARLNRLYKAGILDRLQLGHKVYYRFDAGKTTNTLIITPPQ
jgi:hypothetical protein